ncbi:transglycosylase SLT domain-containing protein [Streptomyces sp. NPDC001056]
MSAAVQPRRTRANRLVRLIAAAGTGAAVLAMPLVGAATASATTASATTGTTGTTSAATTLAGYPNNLDGWIRESLAIMAQKGIPGSYNGIYRNIIRESSGNPNAINLWDSNAAKGIPSKGLLQVIDPTFNAYHVAGTSFNIYDPVANITAACNYAAHRYGSIDNVHGAY